MRRTLIEEMADIVAGIWLIAVAVAICIFIFSREDPKDKDQASQERSAIKYHHAVEVTIP